MSSYSRIHIFRFIAQLLHPTAIPDTFYFPAPQIFWDRLVQLGSSHLVLPAIYRALSRKKLIDHTPQDLLLYLQEITDLNQKRNTAILKQIDFLSELFNINQIDYVFIKGAAMLITKSYDAINERMIGDIDILVSEMDLVKAQQLLIDKGFKPVSNEFSFTNGVFHENQYRHLKRITHPDYIAAVEIHRRLLKRKNLIPAKDVLRNKVKSIYGHWVSSRQHLWQHAILNWQYNDNGIARNDLAFRTVVDVLYLEPKEGMPKLKTAPKAIKYFYSLLSLYFSNYKTYYLTKKLVYKYKLQSGFFDSIHSFFRSFFEFISFSFFHVLLFLSSAIFRKKILNNQKTFWKRILNFWNKY